MHDRFVSAVLQAPQHTPFLPLAHAELGSRLLLCDQFLLCSLQRDQPVAVFLGHQELVGPFPTPQPLPVNRTFLLCTIRTFSLCYKTRGENVDRREEFLLS
jgi:hypothetical protein